MPPGNHLDVERGTVTEPNFPIGLVLAEETRRALERAAGAVGLSPAGYIEELIARDLAPKPKRKSLTVEIPPEWIDEIDMVRKKHERRDAVVFAALAFEIVDRTQLAGLRRAAAQGEAPACEAVPATAD